jgi:hypothetical protein
MGHSNGEMTEGEQMQRSDQRESIQVESRPQLGLRTLIAWWWDGRLFFDESEHHEADLLDEGTSLVKSQLTFLCQI